MTSPKVDIDLNIGFPLQIHIEGIEEPFETHVIGKEPGHFLIVKKPDHIDEAGSLAEQDTIQIRFLHLGEIYEFEATVLKVATDLFPMYFLAYPASIENISVRRTRRIVCFIPALMSFDDADFDGIILNMSQIGCRFFLKTASLTAPPPVVKDFVSLDFTVLGAEGVLKFKGVVRNIQTTERGKSYGIEFLNIPYEFVSQIDSYIDTAMDYIRQSEDLMQKYNQYASIF